MASSLIPFPSIDDKDLDDAALWAVIDSAAAAAASAHSSTTATHLRTPTPVSNPSPPIPQRRTPIHTTRRRAVIEAEGEVVHEPTPGSRPTKVAVISKGRCPDRISESSYNSSPLAIVNRAMPKSPSPYRGCVSSPEAYLSPEIGKCGMGVESGNGNGSSPGGHSLEGRFPSVGLFKEFQNAAMAILEKTDFTMISGHPFIKKSGWRKMAFFFNISFEIRDKTIEFDENRNVQRAEFVVRGHMQGGRFSDAWGSCERREKKFLKPNHDIPSTAETRAKNKACQDLLGIGEYRPGASQVHH